MRTFKGSKYLLTTILRWPIDLSKVHLRSFITVLKAPHRLLEPSYKKDKLIGTIIILVFKKNFKL